MPNAALWWVAIALALNPVRAAGPGQSVSGSAFGVSVSSSLVGPLVPPTPGGVSGSAANQGSGFSSSQGIGPINLAGIVQVGAIAAATGGSLGAPSSARSEAVLTAISIANGLLTAAGVTSTCTASPGGVSGSVDLTRVTLGGTPVAVPPGTGTNVSIPGVLTAVLDERVASGPDSIEVRAIDVQVLPTSAGGAVLDVVLGDARCAATPATQHPASSGLSLARPAPAAPPSPSPPAPTQTTTPAASQPAPRAPEPPVQPPNPPSTAATLVVTPSAGPPGGEITVSASSYPACPQVLVFFRGTRIGSAAPAPGGDLHVSSLVIPGDTGPGRYVVSAGCASGGVATRAATFTVGRYRVHRSAFATSLTDPSQVSTSLKVLAVSVGVAGGFTLVAAFPSELFNSTLDANYVEIRGWFGLGPPKEREPNRLREVAIFIAFVILGGILGGLLSPDFGFNRSSLALALGIAAALVIIMFVYSLPLLVHVRSRHGQWGGLKVLPGTALIAAACVLLSRAVHFQPGYLLGLVAGLDFAQELATDTTGRLTLVASGLLLAVGVGAWVLRTPVAAAAGRPGAGFWLIAAEACLAAVFVCALESVVFCMLPLRFLDGIKLTSWKVVAWAVVFGVAVLAFVHILLQPSSGYVSPATGASRWTAIALFLGFGLFSVGFWAYFRFRRPRAESTPATYQTSRSS